MKTYLDTVIVGLGLFFLSFGFYLVWERQTPHNFVYASSSTTSKISVPSRLTISSVNIDLPIYSSRIVDGKWGVTSDGVSYLSTSPLPGKVGNTVMYGHNWANLLGSLKNVKTGDTISITTSDGTVLKYIVHFVSVVTPDETHIYQNTEDYRLTLYTCTGFLDSKRLVITAILE